MNQTKSCCCIIGYAHGYTTMFLSKTVKMCLSIVTNILYVYSSVFEGVSQSSTEIHASKQHRKVLIRLSVFSFLSGIMPLIQRFEVNSGSLAHLNW